jgi:hypothetical protein
LGNWLWEEDWRERDRRLRRLRKAKDRFESVEASNNKGEGMSRKIGMKFKQIQSDASSSSGGEMEGVVRSLGAQAMH